MPHNLELERALLGLLLDGRSAIAMQAVRATVPHPLAFFHRDHRMLYVACLDLDDNGHRVDGMAVCELLARYPFQAMIERLRQQQLLFEADQLDALDRQRLRALLKRGPDETTAQLSDSALAAVGGYNAVLSMINAAISPSDMARNITLLWDYYLKRRLIRRLQALCDKAYRTPAEFPQLLDEGNQAVLDLNKLNRVATVHAVTDVVDQTLHRITEQNAHPEQLVRTGFDRIDKMLVALRPGGLYVLAARPGVGKTSMALKIVANIAGGGDADHRHGVLFFSLEVDRVDLLKKLLAAESGVDFSKLDTGSVDAEEMALVEQAGNACRSWSLHLMDVADLTVHALRSVVKRHQLETQGALKLVVIDYLQLLRSAKSESTEYERISEISRILKMMAMDLHLPVVALSQMSREGEKGTSTQPRDPRLSDLRGSGSIEQDADAVLFMHRVDGGEGSQDEVRRLKLIVAKNRFGQTGSMPIDFYPGRLRFVPREHEETMEDEGEEAPRGRGRPPSARRRTQDPPSADEDQFGSAEPAPGGESTLF